MYKKIIIFILLVIMVVILFEIFKKEPLKIETPNYGYNPNPPMSLTAQENNLRHKIATESAQTITLDEWRNVAPGLLKKEIHNSIGDAEFVNTMKGKNFNQIIKELRDKSVVIPKIKDVTDTEK